MHLSFIKLDINILDDTKIKYLLKLPDGDKLFRLWVGLLCLGMKSGRPGIVEIGDSIPFTAETLTGHFDLELNTVKLALDMFQKLRMIEVWEDQTIFILNFERHQELNKIERAKEISRLSSRKYREKIKMIGDGHVTDGDETEKEKEIDQDQDFENFWNSYNKKVGKEKSYKRWKSLKTEERELIFKQLPFYIQSTPDKQFRKNPLTYLNQKSWEDEIIIPETIKPSLQDTIPAAHRMEN